MRAWQASRETNSFTLGKEALLQTGIVLFYPGKNEEAAKYYWQLNLLAEQRDDKLFVEKAVANLNSIKILPPGT
jgi:predicted glycosyltransferase